MENPTSGTTEAPLFRSVLMGGFECSTHRLRNGRRLDVIGATGHDRWTRSDYEALSSLGIQSVRDGIRWHLIERIPGVHDFKDVEPMLTAARTTGVQPIWDLLHYGWPDGLDILGSEFVQRFAQFAAAFVRFARPLMDEPLWIVPINEISFFAWAGGEIGIFNPFVRGQGDRLKTALVRASIAAMRSILDIDPETRFVHSDPMIHVAAHPDRPQDVSAAEAHHESQYAAFDMIAGRRHPELGGQEDYLGVLGLNYYIHNQWSYPGGHGSTIEPSRANYRPVWQMLREVHKRYRRPLFIAETGIEDVARPAWLRYMGAEVRRAISAGVPVHGLCWYPILNHPGWDDDRHCYNGLLDYADIGGKREVYEPLAQEIHHQRRLFEGVSDPDSEAADASVLDDAAHWMEIRSGREEIFLK
jgi:polysaccharide biosynthesis protein PelF